MRLITRTQAITGRRSVLWTLVLRDLRVRYSRSVLGYVWTVLDPLLMSLIYYLVFVHIFRRDDLGHEPYFLFLLVGLLSWQWFSGCLTDTSRALIQEAKLVRSTNLPREMWVLRVVLSKGIEYLLSLPVLLAFLVLYLVQGVAELNGWVVLLPLGILLQGVTLVGIGLLLAPVTALVTDMQRVIRIVIRMLFYATPVIYANQLVPEPYDKVAWLNPLTGILELMRAGFFSHDQFPIVWGAVAVSAVLSVVLLLLGVAVFGRLERAVLKEI
ncbi:MULTISPECIES: ABC transporter permease [unclassified Knoellia]|uniref:ABC transporter permease n=1 Tax=unclassified Knoellia TaxID=2618719 RepID=UPI0023DCE05A|nr:MULTISPECIES: ABC transporter permease [unclassified Knoellia]MDF2093145.1 ABC transporter permease [Knoellia sp. 3-2P3]MDF2146470.1 ABC transporter permease [Knoellia sp. p5-6-4]